MAATAAQIAQLARMVNEEERAAYSNGALQAYIETYPTIDDRGTDPYWWDSSTTPPTQTANVDWIPTYDLHAAAADIWEEKAAMLVGSAGGRQDDNIARTAALEQALKFARFHASRRNPHTITARMKPDIKLTSEVIGNLAEPGDL